MTVRTQRSANAFKFGFDYPVVGASEFQKLHETLQSFGVDVSSMLTEVAEENWPYWIIERLEGLEREHKVSHELWILFRAYTAMIGLSSNNEKIQREYLQKISDVGTKFCNDAIVPIVANGTPTMKVMAISILEKTRDFLMVD